MRERIQQVKAAHLSLPTLCYYVPGGLKLCVNGLGLWPSACKASKVLNVSQVRQDMKPKTVERDGKTADRMHRPKPSVHFYGISRSSTTAPPGPELRLAELALTQQRRAELGVDAPVLGEGPEHEPVSAVQLGQADVGLHHLHLPVRVKEIPAAGPDHDEHRDPHALLHHLQQPCRRDGGGSAPAGREPSAGRPTGKAARGRPRLTHARGGPSFHEARAQLDPPGTCGEARQNRPRRAAAPSREPPGPYLRAPR